VIARAEQRQGVSDVVAAAGARAGENVAGAVADHPGLGQIEVQFAGGAKQHAGRGLALGIVGGTGTRGGGQK
jgi:hypothetical protein